MDFLVWIWLFTVVSERDTNPEVYGNVLHDEVLQDVACFPHHRSTISCFFIVAVMVVMLLIVAVTVHLESFGGMRWNIAQKMARTVKVEDYRDYPPIISTVMGSAFPV